MKKSKKKLSDTVLRILIWLFAFITVSFLAWILIYVISKGLPHVNWEFICTEYKGDKHGIFPMIVNTTIIIVLTLVIATPISIFSAIYLVEYSKGGKIVKLIRFATETLAGIPSIIYGLFGYIFFVTLLKFQFSMIAGALTLCIMVLPVIVRTTEEALKSVPMSYREGSLALGATRLRTITKVVLPCAVPGIVSALILSMGRIVGETAALIYTSGIVTRIAKGIKYSGRTLSLHLFVLANEGISFEEAYGTATVLIVIIIMINFAANKIADSIRKI